MQLKQVILVGGTLIFVFAGIFFTERTSSVSCYAKDNPVMSIEDAIAKYRDALLALPGVVGVGQSRCNGQPCIKIYVESHRSDLKKQIGDLLKGHRFEIQQSAKFKARPTQP